MTVAFAMGSRALDKGVHDLLVAGMLEIDLKPVVFDLADGAVAEFLVEHPVADREAANLRDLAATQRHPRALDQQGLAAGAAHLRLVPGRTPAGRGGGPARRGGARSEGRPEPEAKLGDDLDMIWRQLVDKARPRCALPLAMDAPVGGERHEHAPPRPGQPDIGKAALLLEPLQPVLL